MRTRILAFRPEDRIGESLEQAREVGVDLRVLPLVTIHPAPRPELQEFLEALNRGEVDLVVFSSPSSLRALLEATGDRSAAVLERLRRIQIVAMGERTARELRGTGVRPRVPATFSSQGVVDMLKGMDLVGHRVFLLRSSEGTADLPRDLSDLGAQVTDIALYELHPVASERVLGELRQAVLGGHFHGYAFTSSLTARTFFSLVEEGGILEEAVAELQRRVVGAIGRPTQEVVESMGVACVVPRRSTFRDLLLVIRERILAKAL